MTNYEYWQKEKYGNIIEENGLPEIENGFEAREVNEKKMEDVVMINLIEQEF